MKPWGTQGNPGNWAKTNHAPVRQQLQKQKDTNDNYFPLLVDLNLANEPTTYDSNAGEKYWAQGGPID